MRNIFRKIPDQVIRLTVVFVIFVGGIFLIRLTIPASFKKTELQMESAIEREKAKEIKYAGAGVCSECHETEHSSKKAGYHRNLSCETCHGPAQAHAGDPLSSKPPAPRDRRFCPICHTYNPSRPMGFPQINPVVHNPLDPCIACHDPHDPKPPETPRECMACHAEIERTKAVSPHVLLQCATCHTTPENHKVTPWSVRPTKPTNREFCGQCHGKDAAVKRTAKVDLATHGEKYLCWQCHYPHMPEVK